MAKGACIKLIAIALFVFFSSTLMANTDLFCELEYNSEGQKVLVESISHGEKNRIIARHEEYTLFISSLGGDKFELQAYDAQRLMRSYATARINTENAIQLSLWKRESLMEISCYLR